MMFLMGGAAWATVLVWSLPLEGVARGLMTLPFAIFLFGAYRLYLTFRSVVIAADTLELRHPWGLRLVRFADIQAIRFDSYPHDLVVKTANREYRLPRTVEGFRNLHEIVIQRTHQGEHETLPVEVRVRRSLRLISLFAITQQVMFGYLILREGLTVFSGVLCAALLVATYVFLDQYFLRRCIFQVDGLWVHGLLGKKFFPHSALSETEVKKTTLWSRMRLHFGTQTVTLEDRVMDLPVVRLARIVENEWGHGVHGVRPPKAA